MKAFVRRFISSKQGKIFLALLLVVLLASAGLGAHVISGVLVNMKKAALPDNSPPWFPDYPPVTTPSDPAMAERVTRGGYLVKAGDCMACHTDTHNKGKVFAGGLDMQTPFGMMYTPNITPDPETGIGNWTDEQFLRAMKRGISPTGHYYYPAFPFPYFARMPDEDLLAIRAYLDSIPPVHQQNRDNDMVWPFSLRILQLPWRILFFHPSRDEVFPPFTDTANQPLERGEYLVEGPGHCGMCHTPSWHILTEDLPLGAPIKKYNLTGAKVQGYMALNISAGNLGNVPVDEIVRIFTGDALAGGGKVVGPMLEVNHDSLRLLSETDLEAIAEYLKSVKSEQPPKPSGANAGRGIYEASCAGCHAAGAGGAPRFGDVAAWAPLLAGGIDPLYLNALHGLNGMPAKGACLSCTDEDIRKAVDYMLAPVMGKKASMAALASAPKKLTMADGERIYQENCSVCHAAGFHGAPKPGDVAAFAPAVKQGFLRTWLSVVTGNQGHPVHGACPTCSDAELEAAVKYMMQQSAPGRDYSLW